MPARELVVLGTASQAPTRYRNHNGYLLRWDTEGLLFDPGEGTQRQLLLAGEASSAVTRICITHFHGDHCLGLPGVLQRLSLDRVVHPVAVSYPASGQLFFERLRTCALYDDAVTVIPHPLTGPGTVDPGPDPFRLEAISLDHRAETYGYRLVEPDGRRMLPERLAAAGVAGPDIGRLQREGELALPGGGRVTLEEMSEHRPGQRFAFVMDTRLCDGAFALADGVDLLVCESTYLSADAGLAADYGHLTAAQAARIAAESGARRLVLTHFSQRYTDPWAFAAEAGEVFPDVVVASDLDRIAVPARRS
ncbi:MAG: ribonuclease Z [Acidimicrobiia bacterium]